MAAITSTSGPVEIGADARTVEGSVIGSYGHMVEIRLALDDWVQK